MTDISQIAFKSEQILGKPHHRWKEFLSAAIQQSRFEGYLGNGGLTPAAFVSELKKVKGLTAGTQRRQGSGR